jgi:hypothetical protein
MRDLFNCNKEEKIDFLNKAFPRRGGEGVFTKGLRPFVLPHSVLKCMVENIEFLIYNA